MKRPKFSHKTPHLKGKQHQLDPNIDLKQSVHHATVQYVDWDNDGDVDEYDKKPKLVPDENPVGDYEKVSKKLIAKQKGEVKHTKRGMAYEDLRDWFGKSKSKDGKPGWVQADGSPCANEPDDKGKTPKCFSSQRLASLKAQGKKGEAKIRTAVRKKREKDPSQQKKSGGEKPTMVRTFSKPEDYKKHPSGDNHESFNFSEEKKQPDHEHSMIRSELATIRKAVDRLNKKVKGEGNVEAWVQSKITKAADYIDSAADYLDSGEHNVHGSMDEAKDPCWTGYKQVGMKKKGKKMVPNCVPTSESVSPIVQRVLERYQGELELQNLEEKNVPTNPSLWSKMKAKAKAKFDVYPSAYANGWAAKEYKKAGGGWKSVSEEVEVCGRCGKCPCECKRPRGGDSAKSGPNKNYVKPMGEETIELQDAYGETFAVIQDLVNPEPLKGTSDEDFNTYDIESMTESIRVPSQNGNVYLVSFQWRGKFMMMKVFFPEVRRPSRQEVEVALQKVYPGSKVQRFDISTIDYSDPYINAGKVNEEREVEQPKERLKTDRNMFSISKDEREAARERLLAKAAAKRAEKMKEENEIEEGAAWTKKEGKNKEGGLNEKGRKSYERENPGSDLKAPVTTPPSKLDPDSKSAKRRKSFCARMGGSKGPMKDEKGRPTRKALALRKWNC